MIPTFTVTFISSVLSLVISIVKMKVRSGNIPENMQYCRLYSFLLSFCNWYLSLFN